ncbi:hypothetical protein SARC_01665 [Sphaeroforma arctica JP610]|uniref:Vacuolar protein sorting-associated protein 26 n=1 Tax=Sphaeroforma arctica JP610 TaxID=667725 RepID=A0A0L0GD72_9EUKA|nr:hypothetical protein SARC_01665 [Sphaeroforma arctica JP610]KNC86188.1 hypothetical protein SARC_01665 [Sphaeroforma arctica JP610]|eukprot:XP_014160090.1 hypothetical protein SARC_01665 [Sphaeroforma arctica JP610]
MSKVLKLLLNSNNANSNAVSIDLDDLDRRLKHGADQIPVYTDGEPVKGTVTVHAKPGKTIDHYGIRVEFVGECVLPFESSLSTEFVSLARELAPPGVLTSTSSYPFNFTHVEKQYETYHGTNVRLRYYLRVTIGKRFGDFRKEQELFVYGVSEEEDTATPRLKMELGIEDALHIEFEYSKAKYHLNDVIIGKLFFLVVRLKLKFSELAIVRRETVGSGSQTYTHSDTITKFEIMDGISANGETIPIRLFLSGVDNIQPTMWDVCKRFSVRYFLNMVLVDEDDRRYFKQQEITLVRQPVPVLSNAK